MLRTLAAFSWICLSIGLAADFAPAESFPYGAYVKTNAAAVRSGPGAEFYATERLEHGTRVEVYRHDDQWAAIRPPDGSFSWIPVDAVELTDTEPLGKVTMAGIKTRIGTRYGDEHNVEFVPLRKGEIVEILGERRFPGSSQNWYKILPCAGEFRWVRLSSLTPITAEVVTDASQDDGVRLAQNIEDGPTLADPDRLDTSGGVWQIDPSPADLEPQPAPANDELDFSENDSELAKDVPSPEPAGFRPINTDDLQNVGPVAERPASAWDDLSRAPRRQRTTSPELLRQELSSIHVDLSRMVIRTPSLWRLGELRARSQAVIDLSSTNDVRSQAQQMLARIAQFEDLQRRHESFARRAAKDTFGTDVDLSVLALDGMTTMEGQRSPSAAAWRDDFQKATAGGYYDGIGWLMPVVTRRPGVPRYALTDHNGNILQFVSPKPGLNLRNYERKRIGVIGQRGYMPEFDKAHLTAERIITLDRVRY